MPHCRNVIAKRSLKGTDLRKGTAFPHGEDLDFSLNLSFRFLANYLSTSNRKSGSWELRRDDHQGHSCMMLRENEILTFLVLTQHLYQRSPWQQVGRESLRTVSAKGPVLPSSGPRLQPSSGGLQTARKRLDFCGVGRGGSSEHSVTPGAVKLGSPGISLNHISVTG